MYRDRQTDIETDILTDIGTEIGTEIDIGTGRAGRQVPIFSYLFLFFWPIPIYSYFPRKTPIFPEIWTKLL